MRGRRLVQSLSLALFLGLLLAAGSPLSQYLPVRLFLRLDPLAGVLTYLSARTFVPGLWTALVLLGLTLVFGRFFCGLVCPLGTSIDAVDALLARARRTPPPEGLRRDQGDEPQGKLLPLLSAASSGEFDLRAIKYLLLIFLLGCGALGVSYALLFAPLALAARLYVHIVLPALSLPFKALLGLLRPLALLPGLGGLAYVQIDPPRYALQEFTLLWLGGIFAAGLAAPRFWCRYLCPAGALFALCSRRPRLRRRVSPACTGCSRCREACPMRAIGPDPRQVNPAECIACLTCVEVCPEKAVRFALDSPDPDRPEAGPPPSPGGKACGGLSRRALLAAFLAGLGAALVTLTGLKSPHGRGPLGRIVDQALIRPPGALPEPDFLARCIGCGACMQACPTNTLQPLGLAAGISGLLSPVVTPRRGPCETACTLCGKACPTGALRTLDAGEKLWAKLGTAHIVKERCLAWEYERECLVCDEVCPYGAVELRPENGRVVPFVREERCSGCGFCEYHCPVEGRSAIVVTPMDALRLETGSYLEVGRARGLSLEVGPGAAAADGQGAFEGGLPPGFEP